MPFGHETETAPIRDLIRAKCPNFNAEAAKDRWDR
jgi:hypothetical protein